jgi:hypothetical protein
MPVEVILVLAGAAVLGALLIRLGRQIALALMGAGIVGVLVIGALALLEQAQAGREAAKAAKVMAVGQTAGSITLTVLVALLAVVVVLAAAAIGYFWLRARRAERWLIPQQHQRPGRWAPGPNAHWQQTDDRPTLAGGAGMQQMLEHLMQLEALRLLREMQTGRSQYHHAPLDFLPNQGDAYALPAGDDGEDEELWPLWWREQ